MLFWSPSTNPHNQWQETHDYPIIILTYGYYWQCGSGTVYWQVANICKHPSVEAAGVISSLLCCNCIYSLWENTSLSSILSLVSFMNCGCLQHLTFPWTDRVIAMVQLPTQHKGCLQCSNHSDSVHNRSQRDSHWGMGSCFSAAQRKCETSTPHQVIRYSKRLFCCAVQLASLLGHPSNQWEQEIWEVENHLCLNQ